ncbi:MAG: potassium-transporting ATPase subunit C [Pirellula sp.]|nr:potassium-transporting ATPase subunit C [Pirellula sp.]
MLSQLRPAAVVFLALTLITGVAYPLLITGVSQVAFSRQAQGSLIERDGHVVGSELIGQGFTGSKYFWSRPSAAGYNGAASTGSNLGPTNPAQLDAVRQRIADLRAAHGDDKPVPIDLVTASGSGLDPHITPAAAEYQLGRVARERGITPDAVRQAVVDATEGRTFGLLGEPGVNVLRLNLALDASQQGK